MPTKHHGYENEHMAVMCAGYVKNPEDNQWYFHQEVLPPPRVPAAFMGNLQIHVTLDTDEDERQDMVTEEYASF